MYVEIPRDTVFRLFGIKENVPCVAEDMARSLTVTFFPHDPSRVSRNIKTFAAKLDKTLRELGVNVISYEEALTRPPFGRTMKLYLFRIASILVYLFRAVKGGRNAYDRFDPRVLFSIRTGKKIRKGISVISLGEGQAGALPIDFTMSFSKSNVITILDMPRHITTDTEFHEHFDTMMKLFAHHMTNVAIVVDAISWIPYNFNASHPRFFRGKDFKKNVLSTLIPKIAAPISPPKLSEFIVEENTFDVKDPTIAPFVEDFIQSAALLQKTKLYPPGKTIDDLPFRNDFYRWAGKIHLDERSGMSYGFLARQLPVRLLRVFSGKEAEAVLGDECVENNRQRYFYHDGKLYISVFVRGEKWYMEVPDVWVLSQRSGSDKTNMNPQKDMIMLGLVGGNMVLRTPNGMVIHNDYKPSFDTKVILAHALGNAIIASLIKTFRPHWGFARMIEKNGAAIAHWHGYLNREMVPEGWYTHGVQNPRVPCSSPQSAVYAFEGKMEAFSKSMEEDKEYRGDIHIEPDHGTNIVFPSLAEFASFLYSHPDASRLGNYYFSHYE